MPAPDRLRPSINTVQETATVTISMEALVSMERAIANATEIAMTVAALEHHRPLTATFPAKTLSLRRHVSIRFPIR